MKIKHVICLISLLSFSFSAQSEVITGQVIKISDGDTLTLLTPDKSQLKIRLTEIDAPEKHQAYGNKSKQALAKLCFRQLATVVSARSDRYGRKLGRVTCRGIDVNAEQIKTGMAWVYDQYVSDKKLYELQTEAKLNKVGLWKDADPIPPWIYRATKKHKHFLFW